MTVDPLIDKSEFAARVRLTAHANGNTAVMLTLLLIIVVLALIFGGIGFGRRGRV